MLRTWHWKQDTKYPPTLQGLKVKDSTYETQFGNLGYGMKDLYVLYMLVFVPSNSRKGVLTLIVVGNTRHKFTLIEPWWYIFFVCFDPHFWFVIQSLLKHQQIMYEHLKYSAFFSIWMQLWSSHKFPSSFCYYCLQSISFLALLPPSNLNFRFFSLSVCDIGFFSLACIKGDKNFNCWKWVNLCISQTSTSQKGVNFHHLSQKKLSWSQQLTN